MDVPKESSTWSPAEISETERNPDFAARKCPWWREKGPTSRGVACGDLGCHGHGGRLGTEFAMQASKNADAAS